MLQFRVIIIRYVTTTCTSIIIIARAPQSPRGVSTLRSEWLCDGEGDNVCNMIIIYAVRTRWRKYNTIERALHPHPLTLISVLQSHSKLYAQQITFRLRPVGLKIREN